MPLTAAGQPDVESQNAKLTAPLLPHDQATAEEANRQGDSIAVGAKKEKCTPEAGSPAHKAFIKNVIPGLALAAGTTLTGLSFQYTGLHNYILTFQAGIFGAAFGNLLSTGSGKQKAGVCALALTQLAAFSVYAYHYDKNLMGGVPKTYWPAGAAATGTCLFASVAAAASSRCANQCQGNKENSAPEQEQEQTSTTTLTT